MVGASERGAHESASRSSKVSRIQQFFVWFKISTLYSRYLVHRCKESESMEHHRGGGTRDEWASVEKLGIGVEAEKTLADSVRNKVWLMSSSDA